ncbi:MAG TPA: hypothetical protein VFU41_11000 [Gemmatimonadales bacterium]|nr:hypothetical protein [Gemmatimonadales bacterium]
MGIYGQPNSWTCGPFALKHALLAFGVFAREDDLARVAGSTEQHGTDEPGLRRAARAHGVELRVQRELEPRAADRELRAWLDRGMPVLLCLDQWEHWVTAVAMDGEHVILFDSKYDAPLRAEPWEPVLTRLACRRRYLRGVWTRTLYDLHPVVPRGGAGSRLALTATRARHLLREENAPLAQRWDEYARALLPLSSAPETGAQRGLDLEGVIEARRTVILDLAAGGAGDGLRTRAARAVDGMAFVAGMYRVALRPELEAEAVARLAGIAAELAVFEATAPARAQAAAVAA